LSLDERLKKYVQENDIVDIEFDENGLAAAFDDDNEDDEEYERTHPPVELDDAAFLDITGSFDSDEDNADKVAYVNDAVEDNAQEDEVAFCHRNNSIYRSHNYACQHTASNFPRGGFQFSESCSSKGSISWPRPYNGGFPIEQNYCWWSYV
jgi:hypothetical protein